MKTTRTPYCRNAHAAAALILGATVAQAAYWNLFNM